MFPTFKLFNRYLPIWFLHEFNSIDFYGRSHYTLSTYSRTLHCHCLGCCDSISETGNGEKRFGLLWFVEDVSCGFGNRKITSVLGDWAQRGWRPKNNFIFPFLRLLGYIPHFLWFQTLERSTGFTTIPTSPRSVQLHNRLLICVPMKDFHIYSRIWPT